jgi:hypothetical protein
MDGICNRAADMTNAQNIWLKNIKRADHLRNTRENKRIVFLQEECLKLSSKFSHWRSSGDELSSIKQRISTEQIHTCVFGHILIQKDGLVVKRGLVWRKAA